MADGESTETKEATEQREIHLELGGLIVIAKGPDTIDVLARTALGLIGKLEPMAKRIPSGFGTVHSGHADMRPQPDLTWGGTTWEPEGVS